MGRKPISDEIITKTIELYEQGLRQEKISKILGISPKTVSKYTAHIRKELREKQQILLDQRLRQCTKCKCNKKLTDFYKLGDGLSTRCKTCMETYRQNMTIDRKCTSCSKIFQNYQPRKLCDDCYYNRYSYWTKEECRIGALPYKSRWEFQKHDQSKYQKALKMGWLDEICSHMGKPLTFNGFKRGDFIARCNRKTGLGRLYLIRCFREDEKFYKIGITSGTVNERYRHSGDRFTQKMPYNYKIIWEILGDPERIFDLELEYKNKICDIKYQPEFWRGKSTETFKCHGNCKILRKPS